MTATHDHPPTDSLAQQHHPVSRLSTDVTPGPQHPPPSQGGEQQPLHLSSTFASDYNIKNQIFVHSNHAAYLRSTMEKNLDALNHSIPRTSTVENEKIYFDGVTHAHSLSIQLAREKRRNDTLTHELKEAKRDLRTQNDRRQDSKSKMTRDINTQQHEISNLTGKVMDLKLELKRSIQEKREMQVEFKKYKRNFEREIEGYQRKSMQTINNAEDHLVQYNDEWTKRIEDERQQWIEKVRMREELSEHNIMALQNQFSEAHQFYTDHITKVRKQTMKEEAKRIKVEEELEETKALFLREQAARKALTNQLKKERKWREKCMNVTKTVLNLKSENNLDNEEAAATVSSSPHPSPPASPYIEDPILSMDPSSVAYLQAVAEFERTEHANTAAAEALSGSRYFAPPPPRQPSPVPTVRRQATPLQSATNHVIEEEKRKNKLLTLELLRQRAFHNSGLPSPPPLHADFSNLSVQIPSPRLSSPVRHPPTSPYFPLGSTAGAVIPEEIAALRVAAERADVERVLEAQSGIEKDIELEHLKLELEQERNRRSQEAVQVDDLRGQIDKARQEEREQAAKEYHDMLKKWEAAQRDRDDRANGIKASSAKMYEALEKEKAEHLRERERHRRKVEEAERKAADKLKDEHVKEMKELQMKMNETIEIAQGLQMEKEREKQKHRDEVERVRNEGKLVNDELKMMRQEMAKGKGIVAKVESESISPVSGKVNKRRSMPDVDEDFARKYGVRYEEDGT